MKSIVPSLITVLIFLFTPKIYCNTDSTLIITADKFKNSETFVLKNWEISFNNHSFQDSNSFPLRRFSNINSELPPGEIPDSIWSGIVVFRTSVKIDSSLANKNLGFYFIQKGASEVFLNSRLIYSTGTIFPSTTNEYSVFDRLPHPIMLIPGQENIITVRYANHRLKELWSKNMWAGFSMSIGYIDEMIRDTHNETRFSTVQEIVFLVIPMTLLIVHLFIFLFDVRFKQNFIYVLFLLAFTVFIFTAYQSRFSDNIYTIIDFSEVAGVSLLLMVFFASASIRAIFSKLGKLDILNFLFTVALAFYSLFSDKSYFEIISYVYISYLFTLAGKSIFSPRARKGTFILRVGYVLMSLSGIYQMLLNSGYLPRIYHESGVFIYGVLAFIISMSIYLAYEFIRTGKELEAKVNEVKVLSKENYEKELRAKEKEIENKILEADNDRKTKELEDARQLQLSMLPKRIVSTEYFDIAVKMETAAEVGGDYYDAIHQSSEIMDLTLGDATGHGNKAGVMVAIVKSLFISVGSSLLIHDFFKRCTAVIRKMKLGNLFMSLIYLRTSGKEVMLSSAGMPPVLHYVKNKNVVKEIVIKSMPLGAVKDFPYETKEFSLESGDVLLLFTDGIIELLNEKKEFFGLERLINVFGNLVNETPDNIVKKIFESGDEWKGALSLNDDITIMAIRVK